ncbi:MAG: DUF1553 domain-containing protein [Verrucomicrobia bacterium]|nr:MAG: DUF1553 domain-containing protein [Verrucomicrobiota bacterium]TAE88216.1 MAG: DUF1553 domain-containing protein [Verrucomicrobiota bacterium]TAF26101.1 MAG: DUF1553 domain-containing protein [Verrucomicrobiota bacterium]TAF40974.1 MAG: DUF1553 domain-containing protein [Verrucomicrobiota bacterium]
MQRPNPASGLALALVLALASCDRQPDQAAAQADAAPAVATANPAALPETISFNEHIQPILSEYCYHCHGPDSGTREPKSAPLRLDIETDAFALREDGKPVIIKGKPADSLLVKRLHEKDPEFIMPPPESHKSLNAQQIALLEKWVEQGAPYEAHWSFLPIKRPTPPETGADWAKNPIDRFIAAKLDENGLSPNPAEDPARFFRRLHLDLTGLPPAPEAVANFVAASAKDPQAAVEKAADELLASNASAEHLARYWLDVARYADTHGIHIDNYRAIWPYRDWVVRAFQANMPWDQFTTEQIAGDLLPNRTLDQQIATGFARCMPTTGEGGAIAEEYLAIYAKDQTDTVSATWLGLTAGCAACHDHKFDPISTKEFYSLTAFFRNTPMSALDGNNAEHPPNVFAPLGSDRERWPQIANDIASVQQQLNERSTAARPEFDAWLANAVISPSREIDSTLALHLPLSEDDGPIRGIVDGQPREWPAALSRVDGPLGKAPVVSDAPVILGDLASFSRADRVSYGGFIQVDGPVVGAVIARMEQGPSYRGWDLYLDHGKPSCHVIDSWDKAANKVTGGQALTPGKWHHVMITFDGSISGHQASAIYVDGVNIGATTYPNTVGGNIETSVPLILGSRNANDSRLNGKVALQDFRFYRRLLEPAEIAGLANNSLLRHIASLPADQRSKEQLDSLFNYYLAHVDTPSRDLRTKLDALKTEQATLRARGSATLVMEEKKEEAFAHVLTRGVYSDKGERVTPGTPAVLPPMPADAPKNRLGLARWLNDPANPLPARVTMNRAWYQFFGTGIVETNDDFGIMGARPSHPKLLDWLAAEFIDSKWNYRHMLKLIVSSAAYRQSGAVSPEKLEKDPSNRLVSRGPRFRLDAEVLRDLALSSSGLLSSKVGGPPAKPYQPEGIWEAVAMPQSNTRNYREDQGEGLYRRSLYTFWKRTAPHPAMEILNAPTRETFCVRRDRTNTPLQAFVTLNDPQFVEASRRLAENAMKSSPEAAQRLDFISQRLLSRILDDAERKLVTDTLNASLGSYLFDAAAAKALIDNGETAADATLDPVELAAWTLVSSQLLNLDETLSK